MNCSFDAKEARTGVELVKLVIFNLMQHSFADIVRCVTFCNEYIIIISSDTKTDDLER